VRLFFGDPGHKKWPAWQKAGHSILKSFTFPRSYLGPPFSLRLCDPASSRLSRCPLSAFGNDEPPTSSNTPMGSMAGRLTRNVPKLSTATASARGSTQTRAVIFGAFALPLFLEARSVLSWSEDAARHLRSIEPRTCRILRRFRSTLRRAISRMRSRPGCGKSSAQRPDSRSTAVAGDIWPPILLRGWRQNLGDELDMDTLRLKKIQTQRHRCEVPRGAPMTAWPEPAARSPEELLPGPQSVETNIDPREFRSTG
jgi:hypothetical protein